MFGAGVTDRNARDIDNQISKIIRGLGNPNPPVRLADVRELLRLDLGYYSATDTGLVRETISRLKVAGRQVLGRPTILLDAIRKRDLKALFIPDRKRILLDSDLPLLKQRWGEAHEISHSVLPWHQSFMHGDPNSTLSLSCEVEIESEANFAAGRLLFLRDRFREELLSGSISIPRVKELAKEYGNTITSTLWRAVETCECTAFGMVSQHPHYVSVEKPAVRYFVVSRSFEEKFSSVADTSVFRRISRCCSYRKRGPLADEVIEITDDNGNRHEYHLECFSNSYDVLTLGTFSGALKTTVSVPRCQSSW